MHGAQNTSTRLSIRWSLPEREWLVPLVKRKCLFFLFMHASSLFPVMDLWEFSANLIVFFLFIFFFILILDSFYLFIYSFPISFQCSLKIWVKYVYRDLQVKQLGYSFASYFRLFYGISFHFKMHLRVPVYVKNLVMSRFFEPNKDVGRDIMVFDYLLLSENQTIHLNKYCIQLFQLNLPIGERRAYGIS